mmetsp:Transcript_9757/g.15278  ORF Transcript_9757/g.15278 Transcript_9757/m.15278 type:complete len:177 (+) Transcript_9757:11-541(+)
MTPGTPRSPQWIEEVIHDNDSGGPGAAGSQVLNTDTTARADGQPRGHMHDLVPSTQTSAPLERGRSPEVSAPHQPVQSTQFRGLVIPESPPLRTDPVIEAKVKAIRTDPMPVPQRTGSVRYDAVPKSRSQTPMYKEVTPDPDRVLSHTPVGTSELQSPRHSSSGDSGTGHGGSAEV